MSYDDPPVSRRPGPGRPLLVYDGDCGFCLRWVRRWQRSTRGRVDAAPAAEVAEWFPGLAPEALARAVHLVEPDGRVSQGAEAVFRALAYGPGRRWLSALYGRVPGVAPVSEWIYGLVASRRRHFSRLDRLVHGRQEGVAGHLLTRWLFVRALALVYLVAFLSLWPQVNGLSGPQGILPARDLLQAAAEQGAGFFQLPTLAWLAPERNLAPLFCGLGAVAAVLVLAGLWPLPLLALLWLLYLSLTSTGRVFLAFQWDTLLLEAGFLALLLGPWRPQRGLAPQAPPPTSALWMLRWLLFRLMLGSGLVKLASGDAAWRDLTALSYHHLTQPLPTPLAWLLHQFPAGFHQAAALGTFGVELLLPFLIFAPRRLRLLPLGGFLLLHTAIAASGNYGWFNLLGLVLLVPLLDDGFLARVLPERLTFRIRAQRPRPPALRRTLTLAVALPLLVLSTLFFVHRSFGRDSLPSVVLPAMAAVSPWHLTSGYGLFAVMTTSRREIVVEGSHDGVTWQAYRFRWKPGDPDQAPPLVAPHMPRLDWQMWFAALGNARSTPWFQAFVVRLLEGSPAVTGLLAENPFPDAPPRFIRAEFYDYRFTTFGQDAWWERRRLGTYLPPVSLPR